MKILHHNFKTEDQFLKALHSSGIPLDHPHILVQVFDGTGNSETVKPLLVFITRTMPSCVLVGVTTAGGILNDQLLEDDLLISVLCFEHTRLQAEKSDNPSHNFFDEGVRLGQKLQRNDLKAAILFGEGMSVNGEDLVKGFESQVEDIVIAGGLAAKNPSASQTYLFYQDEILDKGALAVGLYSDTLRAETRWIFDCDSVGEEFIVTESKKNIVRRINNINPEALYKDRLGLQFDKHFIDICAHIPLALKRNGILLARTPISTYPDGSMGFTGNLMTGEKIRFGLFNADKILANAMNIYNEINDQWDVIHIFSCIGRKAVLGDRLTQDIEHFPNIAPINGFFSFGEFVKQKKERALFCNHTMVLLLLSESPNIPISKPVWEYKVPAPIKTASETPNISLKQIIQEQFLLVEHKNKIKAQLVLMEHKNKIMRKMLYKDPLTDLRNRKFLLEEVKKKTLRGVFLIDIRAFHTINDLYGESVGDLILQSFADFLKRQFKHENTYRFSGNTFAILNTCGRLPEECISLARKLVMDVETENFYFNKGETLLECALSVIIGISNEENGKHHLEHADMALNHAKKHNKNIVMYSDSLGIKQKYEKDISIVKMVKKALDDDRVTPFFQPVFSGEKVVYYEALIRIIGEDGSIITPSHFLDVIKNTTYYSYLTRRMVQKTFALFDHLDSMVSINLSFMDFSNMSTIRYLLKMIEAYNMGKKLILEILESEVFQDYESTIYQISQFRNLGAKIAIDDFGSGYSNFLHATQINPDYIKIDGSLIKHIDTDAKSMAICKAIIGFARDLNIETVAEFIHSKKILDITTRLKVDKHQGFYLGEPKRAEDLFPHIFSA